MVSPVSTSRFTGKGIALSHAAGFPIGRMTMNRQRSILEISGLRIQRGERSFSTIFPGAWSAGNMGDSRGERLRQDFPSERR